MEAAPRLGGQILLAANTSWRKDLISIIDWRISELEDAERRASAGGQYAGRCYKSNAAG